MKRESIFETYEITDFKSGSLFKELDTRLELYRIILYEQLCQLIQTSLI